MIQSLFYDFVTLLAIINPIQAAATFMALTRSATPAEQRRIAARGTIVATILLIGFGFGGEFLLKALGVGSAAFRIAGGLLVLRVGFNMVFAKETSEAELAPDGRRLQAEMDDPSIFPLAIPIIAGPGALTTIVELMSKRRESPLELGMIVVIAAVVMAITFVAMRACGRLNRLLGPSGTNAIGRVMGVIVTAISVQLMIDGVQAVFSPTTL